MRVPRFLAAMRPRRRTVVVAVLVAVLLSLTGGLTVTWATAPAYNSQAHAPQVQAERHGLRLTMSLGPGPYFLRELLPVSMSLTNVSNTAVLVPSYVGINGGCAEFFSMTEHGGHAPTYQAPNLRMPSCPGPLPKSLDPGRTVSASGLLALTASGRVTLTGGVNLPSVTTWSANGQTYTVIGDAVDPFDGAWPEVQLTVNPAAPLQRTIWLSQIGRRVYVIAPPATWSHLVYWTEETDSCRCGGGGNYAWEPISTLMIGEPPSAVPNGTWQYAVSAPGYAIADGSIGK